MPALCPEDDGCAVDMVAHKHWDCNGFRVSSQNVNKEPENTGRQVLPQTESSRIAAAQTNSKPADLQRCRSDRSKEPKRTGIREPKNLEQRIQC